MTKKEAIKRWKDRSVRWEWWSESILRYDRDSAHLHLMRPPVNLGDRYDLYEKLLRLINAVDTYALVINHKQIRGACAGRRCGHCGRIPRASAQTEHLLRCIKLATNKLVRMGDTLENIADTFGHVIPTAGKAA